MESFPFFFFVCKCGGHHLLCTASFQGSAAHGGGVRIITGLPHTLEWKNNFFDLQKTKIRLFTQNILVFTHIKIFVYT